MNYVDTKKPIKSRFQAHTNILIWKSYLQRQRRWRLLAVETLFASLLFILAVLAAKPTFLTMLEAEPEPPLVASDTLASLNPRNILGYAPNSPPYVEIMERAAKLLNFTMMSAATEDDLNNILYERSKGTPITNPIIWVIWKPLKGNIWRLNIRSTERALYETSIQDNMSANPHLKAGFLAVQLAVSQAILERASPIPPKYEIKLVSMPVSPLMKKSYVRNCISAILLFFTLAMIPPVVESEALVVKETNIRFKRALRLRHVGYSSMYLGWVTYAYLSALPICFLAAITIILIFRWVHLLFALIIVIAYVTVNIMLAFIMAMFHNKPLISAIWSTLFTLMQMFLAQLLVHHEYDLKHIALTLVLHIVLPPLGLVHAFNEFALLQTGHQSEVLSPNSLLYTMALWSMLIMFYFALLMLLQRTIGQQRAIGGQVSWKSIIFKKAQDVNRLRRIDTPTGTERDKLQEVDDLLAKAVSFRNVSKSIMGSPVLSNITLDIYRGEYTMLFSEKIQQKMLVTIEDLLTGLTYPDRGTINILGENSVLGKNFLTVPFMLGYCHRSKTLIDDLTVEEHIIVFLDICLWNESNLGRQEYSEIRTKQLMRECDLEKVKHEQIRNLDLYYKAQLCWAIAMLMEPRIIVLPNFTDEGSYLAVVKDKIMQYKKHMTIIKLCYSSYQLEFVDRAFVFDSKILVFGGTPAYMFFKYGQDYRVRLTLRSEAVHDKERISLLLKRAEESKARVRAHLGSLLILRLPVFPTANVANFVKDISDDSAQYGITSLNISLADSEEVFRRAINESRAANYEQTTSHHLRKEALKRISGPVKWSRTSTTCLNILHLRKVAWKYFTFYAHYKFFLIITCISAILAGAAIGQNLASTMIRLEKDWVANKTIHGQLMTVEKLKTQITLVLRADDSEEARSIANAYVLSEAGSTMAAVNKMEYTALSHSENLVEYLVSRAIDSPQYYVFKYAYGIDVTSKGNGSLDVQALYSPMHLDYSAAARSLARVYMALLRHYTGNFDASIHIKDEPLVLDLSEWTKGAAVPPLLIQFLLILTISHITLLPSHEYGLIRHYQKHAMNFSPSRYWFTLYFCDLILYWILVAVMSTVIFIMMYFIIPAKNFNFQDLLVVPFLLIVYGMACVPQAYIFSLGKRAALNSMTYIFLNVVFGETTVVAKIFYGNALNYLLQFMSLSPQFNMAYAFVKIKTIFLYNTECILFKTKNFCSVNTFHRCCHKCGVLLNCYKKRRYLTYSPGVLMEVIAMIYTAVVFMTLLLLIEYQVIQKVWRYFLRKVTRVPKEDRETLTTGCKREMTDVLDKKEHMKEKRKEKVDTFGEYLLACNVHRKQMGIYTIRNIYFGLGKGEALALSGLKRHGRQTLCEVLAGYKMPSEGQIWCMSRWSVGNNPHKFKSHVSVSSGRPILPPWMTVFDALELIAVLRGVPIKCVHEEVWNYIDALELGEQAHQPVGNILANDRIRLHFAAAVVGAPPIIILDECTAYQKFSVRRAMYHILYYLRKRGHAILISSSSVESHMPVTSRLAIIVDGYIYDIDTVDSFVERYSSKGYTVVVHLKDEVDVKSMFAKYFENFIINDTSEVLVNIQILDKAVTWATIFERMEALQAENTQIYSYIVCAIPIDYIYNSVLSKETGNKVASSVLRTIYRKLTGSSKPKVVPTEAALNRLIRFEKRYHITKLKELPWSVIFKR
ncbi:hypothetical protein K1T71_002143 [Dendrolimus kikuchii]|uniref:Uncharacterized protein n=1 Tax=Dendrolimus kikuchii TaxID=765133 RepID=A0ACC1DFN3_9NEOP|nr:hypothetical protein K1T71_002143 [Dendrolimus kikuchii]